MQNHKRAADYLRAVADLIERGTVDGFSLSWQMDMPQPDGGVMFDARAIKIPERPAIQVVDLTTKPAFPS